MVIVGFQLCLVLIVGEVVLPMFGRLDVVQGGGYDGILAELFGDWWEHHGGLIRLIATIFSLW